MTTIATANEPCKHDSNIISVEKQVLLLSQQINELQNDLCFIKEFFLAKQAKKERRRQKKEQKRLEIQRQKKAEQDRRIYEDIVWEIRHRPWHFMPTPRSKLSTKEFELVSLLAQQKTDAEIAEQMNIKIPSIGARICAINKRLGFNSREQSITYYLEHQKSVRIHRHRRCQILLSWLLHPPPGFIDTPDLRLAWRRTLGRGKRFYFAEAYIPPEVFNSLRVYEHRALKFKTQGFNNLDLANRLKIKETTLKSYFAEIRGSIKRSTGATIMSDQALINLYKDYLKLKRQRDRD